MSRIKKALISLVFISASCPQLTLRKLSGGGGDNGEPLAVLEIEEIPTSVEELKAFVMLKPEFRYGPFVSNIPTQHEDKQFTRQYRSSRVDDYHQMCLLQSKTTASKLLYRTNLDDDVFEALFQDILSNPDQENFELNKIIVPEKVKNICYFTANAEGIITALFYRSKKGEEVVRRFNGKLFDGAFIDIEALGFKMNQECMDLFARSIERDILTIEDNFMDYEAITELKNANCARILESSDEASKNAFQRHQTLYLEQKWYELYVHCVRSAQKNNPQKFTFSWFKNYTEMLEMLLCVSKFLQKDNLPKREVALKIVQKRGYHAVEADGSKLSIYISEVYPDDIELPCASFVEAIEYFLDMPENKEHWAGEIQKALAEIEREYLGLAS